MSISGINNQIYSRPLVSGIAQVTKVSPVTGSNVNSASPVTDATNSDFIQVFTTVINQPRYKSANSAASTAAGALQNTTAIPADAASQTVSVSTSKLVDLDAIFQKAAETYDVPVSLLKAMAKAESNFNVNAVSSCGAMGIMQLMPSTAQALGVSDAFDPEQNIMGGAKYIGGKLEQYDGNITLALAAYNAGSGNVKKYGGVPPFAETKTYINNVFANMGSNISAGTYISQGTPAASTAVSAVADATKNTMTGSGTDSSASELLSLYSSLLGANSVSGISNSSDSLANMAELLTANNSSGTESSKSDLASIANQLMDNGSLSDLSANLMANSNISFETLASTGLMSDWLAAASLTEDEDDGGFSDLINAFNKYNRLNINSIDSSKNNEEA